MDQRLARRGYYGRERNEDAVLAASRTRLRGEAQADFTVKHEAASAVAADMGQTPLNSPAN